jgi:hypothetical protein
MSSWYDRFVKVWANTGVSTDPSDAQANAGFSFLGAAPPSVELFNAMFKWNDQKDTYLYNQMASVFAWGGQTASETNPNTLRDAIIARQRITLTVDTNYYVDVAGNDTTGNGTVGNPWKTIAWAYTYVLLYVDPAGHNINIQLKSPGTYAAATFNIPLLGYFSLTGDKLNPKLYIIKNTNGQAIGLGQSVVLTLQGVALEATGSSNPTIGDPGGYGLLVVRSALCYLDEVAMGVCTLTQIVTGEGGVVWPSRNGAKIYIYGGSTNGNCMAAVTAGQINLNSMTVTFQGNPTFFGATLAAERAGSLYAYGMTFVGTCVSVKYNVNLNGILYTNGNSVNIPGTTAGVVVSGGQLT